MLNYSKDIQIDKYNLVEEWSKQPTLYMAWAEELASATMERDRIKFELDILEAELDSMIRKDPAKFGLVKVTEGSIRSTILQQKDYQVCREKLIEANEKINILQAVKTSLEHKKKALEKITELTISGVYSEPKGSSMDSKVGEMVADNHRKKLKKKITKKKGDSNG